MLSTNSPMHWQEMLRASVVPCSMLDFPTRLETLASLFVSKTLKETF